MSGRPETNGPPGIREQAFREAVEIIRTGGVLVYPTETVYGVGGDARRPDTAQRVRALKGSAFDKPILILTDVWERVRPWIETPGPALRRLMDHQPLLPLTLLFPVREQALPWVRGASDVLGVRRTADPLCRGLVRAADAPLLSTSANPAGSPPPGRFEEIDPNLLGDVDLALDAGRPLRGVPSTVCLVRHDEVVVVREGAVAAATVRAVAFPEKGTGLPS